MRRIFFAITGLLFASILALLLGLRSEPFVLGAAHWLFEAFTDLRLELRQPKVDFYGGSLSAAEVHLMPESSDGPALLSLLDFSAGMPWPGQSVGGASESFLRIGSVLIYVSDNDEAADPEPMQWLGYLSWLPTVLRIDQVHLVTSSADTWIFPLKNVYGDRRDGGKYQVTAAADYEGEPLGALVDLLAVDKGRGVTEAETRITLAAPASGSEFTLAGTLEGTADDFRYNFEVNAFYRDISEFLKGFEGGDDLAGELRLQGTMVGGISGFELSNATFLLNNLPEYAFQVGGRLDYQRSGETGIDLEGLGELASLSYLVHWIDLDLADFGRAQSSIRLSGSLDRPVVEDFTLTTSNEAGLRVSMSGKLDLFDADKDSAPDDEALSVELQGPSIDVLQRWLGEMPFDPGPWRASGQLRGNQNDLSLQNIEVAVGKPDSIQLSANGAIGHITRPQDEQEAYTVSDILVSLEALVPDTARLGELLGRDDIPPHQTLGASVTMMGSAEQLYLRDGSLSITASDLQLDAGPMTGVLRPGDAALFSQVAAPLSLKLSDVAALSQYSARYTSLPIPVLGPLSITASLVQKGKVFQLLDVLGSIREGELDIETRGRIGNLAELGEVSLSTRIEGLDTLTLLAALLPEFEYAQSPGSIAGSFKLQNTQGPWTLSELALKGGDESTPVSFAVDGEIQDVDGTPTANLAAEFRLEDRELLETLSGLPLAPVNGSLKLTSSAREIHSTLAARVGETRINGDTRVALADAEIQGITLKLDTPQLYLQDFGLGQERPQAEASEQQRPQDQSPDQTQKQAQHSGQRQARQQGEPTQPSPGQEPEQQQTNENLAASDTDENLLARLRQSAPQFPVDVSLNIEELGGDASNLDSLQIKVTGIDNRYTLEQFSATYSQALAEIRGIIDLNPEPPAASLAGEAVALPLGAILADVGIDSNVSGALTLLGGITVTGDTTDALVGNLNGSLAFALEDAVIEGAAYDLLATDLLAWIYSGAMTENSTHLDCTMARFDLNQGVAKTKSLYIESSKMVATGKAKFDLVKQKMDVRLTPLSKSRLLQVPSEVRLKGDINDPEAKISAVSAVADATSAALMLIPSLTLKLFGINRSSGENYRPCQADLGASAD